ncbi:MAG: LysE family translocator [Acidobacteriota bacterium]|nr:LysE family translocator [Acidobacteriota bacterium]MDQ3419714.1 LysE family translocator [Acidobacteriota bacterium]
MSLPVWGFIVVTAPLVLSPGATTAVVLRNSIGGGARAGLFTALGANSGSACYGLLSAFGFALALQRWPSVWLLLRWAGVAYLTWLGLQSLRRVVRAPVATGSASTERPLDGWRSFTSGYLTNVLNPSLAAFYLVIVPQFVPRDAPFAWSVMTLMLVHISMAFPWHTTWAIAGATLARVLSRRRPRQLLDAATGVALIWLAAKVAL